MIDYLLALAAVTLAWWLSTGIVLLLNHRSEATRRVAIMFMTVAGAAAIFALPANSRDLSAAGAIYGFLYGLCIWAWLEMTYLMGFITGRRATPCPDGASNLTRFRLGLQTSLYHELLVATCMILTLALTWNGENHVAAGTCATLGLMRWSTKLNLFLGVLNYNQDWLPQHLAYLDSYTRKARMNVLFPFSVTAGTAIALHLLFQALSTENAFLRSQDLLISALLSLAVLEHWFLVIPFGETALWRWAQRENVDTSAAPMRSLTSQKSV